MSKKVVALFFGGQGGEHTFSCVSGISVFKNLISGKNAELYEVIAVGITPSGKMLHLSKEHPFWSNDSEFPELPDDTDAPQLLIDTDKNSNFLYYQDQSWSPLPRPDVAFIILHGTYGEDGSIQGLLQFSQIKYIGCDILGSAICMDKEWMKIALEHFHLPFTDYQMANCFESVDQSKLKFPVFVKASKGGSSVGVDRAENLEDLKLKIKELKNYDGKVLIENEVKGLEIECAVRQTDQKSNQNNNYGIEAAVPGQIVLKENQWYDYNAKNVEKVGTKIPADLDSATLKKCQNLAKLTFAKLQLRGLARIDMFVVDGEPVINEINTLPGFRDISIFPKVFAYQGVEYGQLLSDLIEFAIKN